MLIHLIGEGWRKKCWVLVGCASIFALENGDYCGMMLVWLLLSRSLFVYVIYLVQFFHQAAACLSR
jgi:hypothetical protein